MVCFVAIFSYLAARLGYAFVLRPEMIWPVWPGCAFLVAVLLLTPRHIWPALLTAGLLGFALSDVQEGLAVRSIIMFFLADAMEILVVALGVSYAFGGVPRLNSVKSLAKYSLFAVILAPIAVASVAASAFGGGYRAAWKVGFLTEALALLTLTPALLSWVDIALAWAQKSSAYYVEATVMFVGLGAFAYVAFVVSGGGSYPALLYSLVPFLLWCALRFGIVGISNAMILIAFLSIWGVTHGRGPFTGSIPVNNVLSLQLFLLFASASFMVLAALVEEHKAAEQQVRESEQRFRLLANTAPVFIWMSGTDKTCTYLNQPWLDFTGRSMEEELRTGWGEGVHPDDVQKCLDTYTQSFDRQEKYSVEYRLRRHDGEYRWILDVAVPRFNQDGSFAGYIGVGVDLTDRKLAEETRFRHAAIVESSDDAIISKNLDGTILSWNAGAQRIYEYTVTEAIGKPISMLVPPELGDEQEKILQRLRAGERIEHYETVRLTKTGKRINISLSTFPIKDSSGTILGLSGIARDITELKHTEQVLLGMNRRLIETQEQERARIGRELHDDIAQRLAMLAIDLERLQDTPSELQRHVQQLRKQTTEISNDVQALSHELHSSKLEYLGLVGGMRSWCKEFGERHRMEIDFESHDVPSSLPQEISTCLFRVLQEALNNAAKHSAVRYIDVQLRGDSGEIHLIISDSGKGFDTEAVMQGLGLGLTSMQERVRLVNGTIAIQSKPMGGTTIQVRVPIDSEYAAKREAV